jgi:predicted NACHT family NTPase
MLRRLAWLFFYFPYFQTSSIEDLHKQLTARRAALLPEWELLSEKVKRLRMALAIETDEAKKFQLDRQILAEEGKLSELAAELAEIEQKLSQAAEIIKVSTQIQIDWRTACTELLNFQKQQLTSSPFKLGKARSLDEVHVPLGLVERKEKSLPKFDREQEFSPDKGSQAYHQTETKPIEHDAFLAAVRDRQPGQHLVILGEPGAGKTTLLTKVWQSLLENVDREADIIVAWVPLAAVTDKGLEHYLNNEDNGWIRQFCKTREILTYWESFEKLADAGRVWLLLDGADEMGGDALRKIETTLREDWARSIRAIVTCRLNLWDASPMNSLNSSPNFQIYRTLDFKYVPKDMVGEFIGKWFKAEAEVGKKLRSALDEAGKERIKDLVQNPLRLTLLCEIWEDKPELPDTQAQLYGKFVERVHKLNAAKFPASRFPKLSWIDRWGIWRSGGLINRCCGSDLMKMS